MEDQLHPALLPAGMRDILPPHAETEAGMIERLMHLLAGYGYERVEPPLVEFESSLLAGPGAGMAQETFRLLDPASHRMIGVRADMTLQVARIASTRLINAPRPLRLCYAGQVLRVRGSQLRPARQFGQIGAELIGCALPSADAEVIIIAAQALLEAGIGGLSVDLNLPTMLPALLESFGTDEPDAAALRAAVDHKDATALAALGGDAAPLLLALMRAAGPAPPALERLGTLEIPARLQGEIANLAETVARVGAVLPALALTIDPLENRGFEYHSGLSFTLFAREARSELGRGGRYEASGESSTGFTVYADAIIRAVATRPVRKRVYLPHDLPQQVGDGLRAEGWSTVAALGDTTAVMEARRLGCTHIATEAGPAPIPAD
jgi:ATP phosphoribosyltransferase regulatory subunit